MAPSINFFSRRKNSGERALKQLAMPLGYKGSNLATLSASTAHASTTLTAAGVKNVNVGIARLATPTPKSERKEKKVKESAREKDKNKVITAKGQITSDSALPLSQDEENATPTPTPRPKTPQPGKSKRLRRSKSEVGPGTAAFSLFGKSTNSTAKETPSPPASHDSPDRPATSVSSQPFPSPPGAPSSPVPQSGTYPLRASRTPPGNPAQEVRISLSPGIGILPNELPDPLPIFTSSTAISQSASTPTSPAKQEAATEEPASLEGNAPSSSLGQITQGNSSYSLASHFDFSNSTSLLTPPLSPQVEGDGLSLISLDMGANLGVPTGSMQTRRKPTESELIIEIIALKKALATKDEIISRLDPTGSPSITMPSSLHLSASQNPAHRVNELLYRRIRELEKEIAEKDEMITRHAGKFQTLRQSQNTLLQTVKLSHETEVTVLKQAIKTLGENKGLTMEEIEDKKQLKKKEKELLCLLNEREEELENQKRNNNELRGRIIYVEKLLAQRDGELDVAENRIKRLSKDETSPLEMVDGDGKQNNTSVDNQQDKDDGVRNKLEEEIRKREAAEKELDQVILGRRKEVEEALIIERDQARKELAERIAEEKKKWNDTKAKMHAEFEVVVSEQEEKTREIMEDYETKLYKEERQRIDLQTELEAKIAALEQQIRIQAEEFEAQVAQLKKSENKLKAERSNLVTRTETLANSALDLESVIKKKDQEVSSLRDELETERRHQSLAFGAGEDNSQQSQIIAGRISSVKDENLQLKQMVMMYEDQCKTAYGERDSLKRKLEKSTAQIEDLQGRVDTASKEKAVLERRLKRLCKDKERRGPLPPLPVEAQADQSQSPTTNKYPRPPTPVMNLENHKSVPLLLPSLPPSPPQQPPSPQVKTRARIPSVLRLSPFPPISTSSPLVSMFPSPPSPSLSPLISNTAGGTVRDIRNHGDAEESEARDKHRSRKRNGTLSQSTNPAIFGPPLGKAVVAGLGRLV